MITVRFTLPKDPQGKLDTIGRALRNRIMRIAVSKAAGLVKSDVIANAPARTGSLRKSIRIKVKHYRAKGVWIAVIGASSKYKRSLRKKVIRPVTYAALVESGTRRSRARPYLRPAMDAKQEQYLNAIREKIAEQVDKILRGAEGG